jgi:antitoxin StbD
MAGPSYKIKNLAYLYLKGRVGFKSIQARALYIQTLAATLGQRLKGFSMQKILSKAAVSISELKKNPSRVLADAAGAAVALFDQNRVTAYLVPAELYEQILERLDDFELAALAKARAAEKSIKVSLEDL